jgi:hypothetical protein
MRRRAALLVLSAALSVLAACAQPPVAGSTPAAEQASDAWYYKHTGGVPPR